LVSAVLRRGPVSGTLGVSEQSRMLKLYKHIDGKLRYHEAWVNEKVLFEHWGVVGERGQTTQHKIRFWTNEESAVSSALAPAVSAQYKPIDLEDHATLLVEYAVNGMGNAPDVEKRHRLEDRLNELLGWTGLGHCDGGSIGSGSMEACCYVVDFEIAKRIIADDLQTTEFANFSRIYNEAGDA
jgi:predicted DNA-binding WGR domain protein